MVSVVPRSSGEAEVVEAGDAEHGVVDAVAFQTAIAQDLPALHPDADVFDAGMDCAVRGIGSCFSMPEFRAAPSHGGVG